MNEYSQFFLQPTTRTGVPYVELLIYYFIGIGIIINLAREESSNGSENF
jgi:hypothetical protein